MSTARTLLNEHTPEARDQLLEHAHPVSFPAGTRDDLMPRVGAEPLAYAR